MKRKRAHAFTLIELLVVMVVIVILVAIIFEVAGLASSKAARDRALAEINAMSVACESYKADNGSYPRRTMITEQDTNMPPPPIDPRVNENPLGASYMAASLFLYEQLSGDPGGTFQYTSKVYLPFKPGMLAVTTGSTPKVQYIEDPFGYSYGYSTAAAKAEDDYKTLALQNQAPPPGAAPGPAATPPPRSTPTYGYNPWFDLWSTAGIMRSTAGLIPDSDHARWVKNW